MHVLDMTFIVEFYIYYFIHVLLTMLSVLYIMPLKVSRRRAVLLALIYAQFAPLANALSAYLIGGRHVEYNILWFILLKLFTIIEMGLPLLLIIQTVRFKWYKSYWIYIIIFAFMLFTIPIYNENFNFINVDTGFTYEPVTWSNLWIYLGGIVASVLLAALLSFLLKKFIKLQKIENIPYTIWSIINLFILLLVLMTQKTFLAPEPKYITNYTLAFTGFSMIVILITFIIDYSDRRVLRVENRLLAAQNELQLENLMTRQAHDQELHKLYHDIGNHIRTIQLLVATGERTKASTYAKELLTTYQSIMIKDYCANKIVNAVLLQKVKYCEEQRISTELDLSLPEELKIREIDLMCIISNLMEYAIRISNEQEIAKRFIRFKAQDAEQKLILTVTCGTGLACDSSQGDEGSDRKKDRKQDYPEITGIGEIITRYKGYQEYQETEEELQLRVVLMLPQ